MSQAWGCSETLLVLHSSQPSSQRTKKAQTALPVCQGSPPASRGTRCHTLRPTHERGAVTSRQCCWGSCLKGAAAPAGSAGVWTGHAPGHGGGGCSSLRGASRCRFSGEQATKTTMQLAGVAGCCDLQSTTVSRRVGLDVLHLQSDRGVHAAGELGGHPHAWLVADLGGTCPGGLLPALPASSGESLMPLGLC